LKQASTQATIFLAQMRLMGEDLLGYKRKLAGGEALLSKTLAQWRNKKHWNLASPLTLFAL
jgi:hypothetical protein